MKAQGMVRPYTSLISVFQRVIELFMIWASLALAVLIFSKHWNYAHGFAAIVGMGAYYVASSTFDIYRSWRGQSLLVEIWHVGKCWIATIFTLLFVAFITHPSHSYSRAVIGTWWAMALSGQVLLRVLIRLGLQYLRASGFNSRTAAIVGSGPLATAVARHILDSPSMGIRLLGFYDDTQPIGSRPDAEIALEVIGPLKNLAIDAHTQHIDITYFAMPMGTEIQAKDLIHELTKSATEVHFVPDLFVFNLINARVRDLGGIPTISVFESPLDSFGKLLKRAEDIVFSSLILLVIAVPMLLIALGIKMTSQGSVLFKQRRFGLHGQEINVWKFRSMTTCDDGAVIVQATVNDCRVTPFGRFLRKTSLDELPQFFNVLQGSMSIVGPRPHAVAHNEQYRDLIDQYMLRHLVKPGITGWAQIHGWRGETDTLDKMEQRIKYDMEYIRRWSIGLDFQIILLTILRGFTDKNAR